MKRLTGKDLKDYFRDPDLVPTWWQPEEGRYAFWHEQEFRILDKHLKTSQNWTVLDAACGQGRFARYFARKGCRVHALDINTKMLQIAKERAIREGVGERIEFLENDLEALGQNEVQYDLVTCMDALDHMDDLTLAVQNLTNPLKSGGNLIITYTSDESFYGFLRNLYTKFTNYKSNAGVDIGRTYKLDTFRQIFRDLGIEVEGIYGIGFLMAPQERIRLPLFLNRILELVSRLDIFLMPYHKDNWFARHASVVMIVGRKVG
jgi:2-polyprenyl-3-methyl-5-hydroxy-6-metoxy-1,4-benzoquinol methylase